MALVGAKKEALAVKETLGEEPLTPEDVAALNLGLEQIDRGETFAVEEVMAQARRRIELAKKKS